MREYNVDLEQALRRRPVPGKQVSISVESILAPRERTTAWRKRIIYAFAACAVVISVIFLSKDVWMSGSDMGTVPPHEGYHASNNEDNRTFPMKEKEATALGELQPDQEMDAQLAELDWNGFLEGSTKVAGLELLHREVINEDRQLLFMTRQGGDDYLYELLTVEIKKGQSEAYKVSTSFSAIPLKGPKTYEQQADNDWMTYNWGSFRNEDGHTIRFAFGFVLNERLTEVRFSNKAGQQESALQLSQSNGQRLWFKVLSSELSEGPITIEALNSLTGDLMLIETDGRIKHRYSKNVQNMNSFSALSQQEWREIASGALSHPYLEILNQVNMQDGSQMLLMVDDDRITPVQTYKIYVVNLREESKHDSNKIVIPSSLGVSANVNFADGSLAGKGNEFFHYAWGALYEHAFVFGFIRDAEVAKLQLMDPKGEPLDLPFMTNEQGDRFFVHYFPTNKSDAFDCTIQALDESGNVLS
ncbi:hypothetical protein [Paenibacillus paeoniae]|uniref:Uncharacterized protein n=1 Tax=Paenibacillus paeoniae TaxID=2292705 RepID=A0A371P0M8_9BACL|nr:hypothetical protein [Paenibacillus paeoniae]REK69455.1 hypothetical protein DX130_23370 [Paenibacillus paeoniae]